MICVHANFFMSLTKERGVITAIQMTNSISLSRVNPPEQSLGSWLGEVAHYSTPPSPPNWEAKKYMYVVMKPI